MFWRWRQILVVVWAVVLTTGVFSPSHAQTPTQNFAVEREWKSPQAHSATPLYLWQNDPAVLSAYNLKDVSPFCIPAAVGTAMISQLFYNQKLSQKLELPPLAGVTVFGGDVFLNPSKILLDWIRRCESSKTRGTEIADGLACVLDFYREIGASQSSVVSIRWYEHALELAGVISQNRVPHPEDLVQLLNKGYSVIASVAFAKLDPHSGLLIKRKSHSMNVVGIQKTSETSYQLMVTNPTRAYQMDGVTPLFDVVELVDVESQIQHPRHPSLSSWQFRGRLMDRPGHDNFFSGVSAFKPE